MSATTPYPPVPGTMSGLAFTAHPVENGISSSARIFRTTAEVSFSRYISSGRLCNVLRVVTRKSVLLASRLRISFNNADEASSSSPFKKKLSTTAFRRVLCLAKVITSPSCSMNASSSSSEFFWPRVKGNASDGLMRKLAATNRKENNRSSLMLVQAFFINDGTKVGTVTTWRSGIVWNRSFGKPQTMRSNANIVDQSISPTLYVQRAI